MQATAWAVTTEQADRMGADAELILLQIGDTDADQVFITTDPVTDDSSNDLDIWTDALLDAGWRLVEDWTLRNGQWAARIEPDLAAASKKWATARKAERAAMARLSGAIVAAASMGETELAIAEAAGVARATVRRALGKA